VITELRRRSILGASLPPQGAASFAGDQRRQRTSVSATTSAMSPFLKSLGPAGASGMRALSYRVVVTPSAPVLSEKHSEDTRPTALTTRLALAGSVSVSGSRLSPKRSSPAPRTG
jgi:hypothetical protein